MSRISTLAIVRISFGNGKEMVKIAGDRFVWCEYTSDFRLIRQVNRTLNPQPGLVAPLTPAGRPFPLVKAVLPLVVETSTLHQHLACAVICRYSFPCENPF